MQSWSAILLLLTAALVAQADKISEKLKLPPLPEHLYLFDVISDAPLADVTGALNDPGLETRHSFKEIGKGRYMFVVVSNDTSALRSLAFPAGSEVTQYAIEHTSEFLAMFGLTNTWTEVDSKDLLPDTVLLVHDVQFIQPETQCLGTFKLEMTQWATKVEATHRLVKPVSYAVIASYPPRIFIFDKCEENAMQTVAIMGTEQIGGPGRVISTTTRIVKI